MATANKNLSQYDKSRLPKADGQKIFFAKMYPGALSLPSGAKR